MKNRKDIGSLMVSDYKVLTHSHDSVGRERKKELLNIKNKHAVWCYYTDLLIRLREKYPK